MFDRVLKMPETDQTDTKKLRRTTTTQTNQQKFRYTTTRATNDKEKQEKQISKRNEQNMTTQKPKQQSIIRYR